MPGSAPLSSPVNAGEQSTAPHSRTAGRLPSARARSTARAALAAPSPTGFGTALATRTDAAGCHAAASLKGTQQRSLPHAARRQCSYLSALRSRLDRLCSALHCTCVPRSPLPEHCLPRYGSPRLDRCQHESCLRFIQPPWPPKVFSLIHKHARAAPLLFASLGADTALMLCPDVQWQPRQQLLSNNTYGRSKAGLRFQGFARGGKTGLGPWCQYWPRAALVPVAWRCYPAALLRSLG